MKKSEICQYCGDDYIPKRRGAQRFCSNSCRSRYWTVRQNKNKVTLSIENLKNELPIVKSPNKKETMTLAGVGNAVAGSALAEIGKNILTPTQNKPATKKDIQELKTLINGRRYLPVKNYQNDAYNRKPFYDVETGNVIFL